MIAVLCVLAPCLVAKVESFLKEGRSQRETALQSGVSRGSVGNIYHGRRKLKAPVSPAEPTPAFKSDCPPRRCSVCGATIYPPCQVCQLRRLLAAGKIRPKAFAEGNGDQGELVIRLSPDDRDRYEEILAAKVEGEARVQNAEWRMQNDEEAEPNDEELRRIEAT